MMDVRTKDVPAFDGQVTFRMLPYTSAQSEIVNDDILSAYPNIAQAVRNNAPLSQRESHAVGFAHLYGNTFDIVFSLGEDATPELINFRAWWQDIGQCRDDTIAALSKWLRIYHVGIATAWDIAVATTRQPVPAAPEEIRPGAEQVAEQDPNFTNDGSES